jgi:hypothetical protein
MLSSSVELMLTTFLLAMGILNGWIGFLIRYRRQYGLIAGYDMRRVPAPERLARWVGGWGMTTGGACVAGAIAVALAPERTRLVLLIMAIAIIVSVVAMFAGGSRYAKRER